MQVTRPSTGEIVDLQEFVSAWEAKKIAMQALAAEEKEMRADLVKLAGLENAFGTFRLPLPDGSNMHFSIAKKLEIEKGKDAEFEKVLEAVAKIPGSGSWADDIVAWKPSPQNDVFQKINEYARDHTSPHHNPALAARKLLDDVLILKPQSPQLKIEAPKP